jgi:DNA-binding response OmpR family regulator
VSLAEIVVDDVCPPVHSTVLLIAHHHRIAETVASGLRDHGFGVHISRDTIDLALIERVKPDLILLERLFDRAAPEPDLQLRRGVPVVVIGNNRLSDVVGALDRGVAEYIVAPNRQRELVARLRSVLRRTPTSRSGTVVAGDVTVDLIGRTAALAGTRLKLSPEDAVLLGRLVERAGRVVGRDELIRLVWGADPAVGRRTLTAQVRRLRSLLEVDATCPERILTVRGFGYRYVES